MKVDVIQDIEASFRFNISYWSKWIDICIFDYESQPYLMQMKVSRLNSKRFRSVRMSGGFYRQVFTSTVGNLTQMKDL